MFLACGKKYGQDVDVSDWEFLRLMDFAVDPPEELTSFADDLRLRSRAVLDQLDEGLNGGPGVKGVQEVFEDLMQECDPDSSEWRAADINKLKSELRSAADAAEVRYRAAESERKRRRDEEREQEASKRQQRTPQTRTTQTPRRGVGVSRRGGA